MIVENLNPGEMRKAEKYLFTIRLFYFTIKLFALVKSAHKYLKRPDYLYTISIILIKIKGQSSFRQAPRMNMYSKFASILVSFFILTLTASAQYFEWVNMAVADTSTSNFAQLNVESSYIDQYGNSYYTGSRIRCMACTPEAYIARMNADGTPGFELNYFFDFSTSTNGRSISADDSGNVYVSGNCASNVTFYSSPIIGDNTGYFLVKLDSTGSLIWCRSTNLTGNLSVNNNHEIFISNDDSLNSSIQKLSPVGDSLWTVPLGAKKLSFNSFDCFYALSSGGITKLDQNGGVIWAKDTFGGGNDMVMCHNENLYVVSDTSVFKLDKNGNPDWINDSIGGKYITADTSERIFIVDKAKIFELENDGASVNWEKNIEGGVFRSIGYHPQGKLFLPVYWHVENNPLIIFPYEFLQSPFSIFDDEFVMLASLNLDSLNIPQQVLITTGNCDPTNSGFCKGSVFSIPYNTYSSNFDSTNAFVVELVDGVGNATAIGTPDSCVIPFSIPSATDYRIRVVSTNPPFTSSLNKDGNLWVHDNEPVVLTLNGNNSICQGDSVLLSVDPTGIGIVYVWKLDSNWFFNPTSSYYASTTGSYDVTVIQSFGYCFSTSNAANLVVHPLPTDIDFTGFPDTMCNYNSPITLAGLPYGGAFNGPGITDSIFYPANALLGLNTITYTYTDSFSCSSSIQHDIFVDICLEVQSPAEAISLATYPNPCSDYLQVEFLESFVNSSKNVSIRLNDISGKTVYSDQINISSRKSVRIDTHYFASGIYSCEFVSGSKVVRKQISVVR